MSTLPSESMEDKLLSPAPVPRIVRSRRKLWLTANPSYFERAAHSFALPLAYDRLIRSYQTAAQRQSEGQVHGWARMLEGALLRGEAARDATKKEQHALGHGMPSRLKRTVDAGLDEMNTPRNKIEEKEKRGLKPLPEGVDQEGGSRQHENKPVSSPENKCTVSSASHQIFQSEEETQNLDARWDIPLGITPMDELFSVGLGQAEKLGSLVEHIPSTGPEAVIEGIDKDTAIRRWKELLTIRFVAGDDEEFDYETIDHDEAVDGNWKENRRQEDWFEDEPESWASDRSDEARLQGETGVQDF